MTKTYEVNINEEDILDGKIKILEVKKLTPRGYRVIPKNMKKVNEEIKPGIKIIEEGEIDRIELVDA